jgi:hypothetical protein
MKKHSFLKLWYQRLKIARMLNDNGFAFVDIFLLIIPCICMNVFISTQGSPFEDFPETRLKTSGMDTKNKQGVTYSASSDNFTIV